LRHLRTLLPETNEIARRVRSAGLVLLTGAVAFSALAADTPKGNAKTKKQAAPVGGEPIPLNPEGTVLLDKKGKRVLLKTQVALRQGSLELFCCRKGSKEHESILSLDSRAQVVHAGLLALGAKPGTQFSTIPTINPRQARGSIFSSTGLTKKTNSTGNRPGAGSARPLTATGS